MDSTPVALMTLGCAASISWMLVVLVQRLYWNPLARVPGPWLAAATYWYEFYFNVVQPGRYIFKIQELHEKYGPIVRVTPNEVHVNDVEFLEQVYPTSHLREREKYLKNIGVGMHLSTAVTANHQMHKLRRDAISPYFSHRSVVESEPMLKSKMAQYRQYLNDATDGRVVNFNDVHFALSRDIVFQYCFQRECNLLEDLEQVAVMRSNANGLSLGVHVVVQLPWLMKLLAFLSIFVGDRLTPAGALNLKALGRSISPDIRKALVGPPLDAKTRNVLDVLQEHGECQHPNELPQRLAEEGIFIMLAGTESTNKTLSIAVFYMARNKDIMSRLRAELDSIEPSLKQLGNAQYLNAVIQEANRLAFGLPGRVTARVAPSEAICYKGYTIPSGAAFGTTTLCVHTNSSVFPDPWEFQPERWMGEAGKRLQKYQIGFGRGNRKCLGMNLANAEMQLAISNLIQYDIELFKTDLSDVLIQHEYQVATAKLDSAGIRAKLSKRNI